jgi:hypothetical protein
MPPSPLGLTQGQSESAPLSIRGVTMLWMKSVLWAVCLGLGLLWSEWVHSADTESVRVSQVAMVLDAEGDLTLDAQVSVQLSPVLIDAVSRGVPLYFLTEFELLAKRWYWFDKKIISQAKAVKISYHAITQQFRVAVGGLHQMSYTSLEDALKGALNLRGWQVMEQPNLARLGGPQVLMKTPEAFEARFRVRLDSALLPKPLQVNALTNRDWNLSSEWVPMVLAVSENPSNGNGPGGAMPLEPRTAK